jgi:hypothetical protein
VSFILIGSRAHYSSKSVGQASDLPSPGGWVGSTLPEEGLGQGRCLPTGISRDSCQEVEMVAGQQNNRYLLYPHLYCTFQCVPHARNSTLATVTWLFLECCFLISFRS